MTTWEIVDDRDGINVHISDAGRDALAAEQRAERQREEIRIYTVAGAVVFVAALMIKHLLSL